MNTDQNKDASYRTSLPITQINDRRGIGKHVADFWKILLKDFEKGLGFWSRGKRKRGRPKLPWKETIKKVNLTEEDALNRWKWRKGVWTVKHGVNPATSMKWENTGQKLEHHHHRKTDENRLFSNNNVSTVLRDDFFSLTAVGGFWSLTGQRRHSEYIWLRSHSSGVRCSLSLAPPLAHTKLYFVPHIF